ncbi:MAG: hypothetical protein PVG92_02695 [Holophagae bacterium]
MGIFGSLFGGKKADEVKTYQIEPAGLVMDEDGWFYQESQDYSKSQNSIRIEQSRPGDWEIIEGFCEVDGLNSPERLQQVEAFFTGSFRWLRLEREPGSATTADKVKVIGTFRDKKEKDRKVVLGHLASNIAEEIEREDISDMWGRIRFIRFPKPGRSPLFLIRFDLMGPAGRNRALSA